MKSPTLLLKNFRRKATTLTELMVSTAASTLIAGGLIVGCMAVQRAFYASMQYARNQAQQMRVLDYMSLDLRRATEVVQADSALVSLKIPDYYDETAGGGVGAPFEPIVNSNYEVQYNSGATITVNYTKVGTNIIRTEVFSSGKEVASIIANDVIEWQPVAESSSIMRVSVTFTPTFRQKNQESGQVGTKLFIRTLMRNLRS